MPTSSLKSIAGLLRTNSLKGMAQVLGLHPPIAAKQVRSRASFSFLPGWELVTQNGIAKDEPNNVWHTGHLGNVLPLDSTRLLLAAHTGGVWLASLDEHSSPVPLSNAWPKVDIHCLGFGTRGAKHIYTAGEGGALFETETQSLASLARFFNTKSVKELAAGLDRKPPISVRELLGLSDAPFFDWKPIRLLDMAGNSLNIRAIYQVLCVTAFSPAKLVLATEGGVFWSDVPASGQEYRFARAAGDNVPQTRCLGLALASQAPRSNAHVVCSPQGSPGTPDSNGIYSGTWLSGSLVMVRSTHVGDFDFVQWKDAVVASSAGNRAVLYASVSASGKATLSLKRAFEKAGFSGPSFKFSDLAEKAGIGRPASMDGVIRKFTPPTDENHVYAVVVSTDGGATWAPCGPNGRVGESIEQLQGDTQHEWNMCIAVSPTDTGTIAVGFRRGPWIGRNMPTAFTWEEHGDDGSGNNRSAHLHPDLHGLHFDPYDPQGKTLYVCSDGGMAFTTDLWTFQSSVNRFLPVLQSESYPRRTFSNGGTFDGVSGASFSTPGLVAGALQDNGIVFSSLQNGIQGPWYYREGGDGQVAIFLKNDLLLSCAPDARASKWNGSQFGDAMDVTVRTPSPTIPSGSKFSEPMAEPVFDPQFQRPDTQETLVGVAVNTKYAPRELWGLFSKSDGSDPHWDFLTSVVLDPNDALTAVASYDGLNVLAGSREGKIFSYDVVSGVLSPMQFDLSLSFLARLLGSNSFENVAAKLRVGRPVSLRDVLKLAVKHQVFQFAFLSGGFAIARFESSLLRFEPAKNAWTSIQGNGLPSDEGPLYSIAVDVGRSPAILYLATDYKVHASWDAGENWLPVSQGLPMCSHPSTLSFVTEPSGDRKLYLFTFGRSAWRARLV